MSTKRLCVRNLSASYGKGFRLEEISFNLQGGCITGLIGPNGAGKSTLLSALCGEIPASGTVMAEGEDLWKMPLRQRARTLAMVPQFIEKMPVSLMDFVLMGRNPFKKWYQIFHSEEDKDIARKNIKKVGLGGFDADKKRIDELSGGERQLAAVARALCQQARVLLLDEPTANLDLAHQIDILRSVRKITKESQVATLMVIHDINMAATFCQDILCLCHGKKAAHGTVSEILNKEKIEEIYQTPVCIGTHPQSGSPVIFPLC